MLGSLVPSFFRRRPPYLAHAEYWVYLPTAEMPAQEQIMDRMLAGNPHPGAPIGKDEALLFSDVRLHIALVLRAKNPHVFRPDLFAEDLPVTPDTLAALSESESFVKVRYISEEPLPDKRHLQFLPHAADAVCALGGGLVVYDSVAERLFSPAELAQELSAHRDATRPSLHTRIVWKPRPQGGYAETRGLVKVGLREIASEEMDHDQRVLVKDILEDAIEALWDQPSMPESLEVSAFEDRYLLEFRAHGKGPARVTILKAPPE